MINRLRKEWTSKATVLVQHRYERTSVSQVYPDITKEQFSLATLRLALDTNFWRCTNVSLSIDTRSLSKWGAQGKHRNNNTMQSDLRTCALPIKRDIKSHLRHYTVDLHTSGIVMRLAADAESKDRVTRHVHHAVVRQCLGAKAECNLTGHVNRKYPRRPT